MTSWNRDLNSNLLPGSFWMHFKTVFDIKSVETESETSH